MTDRKEIQSLLGKVKNTDKELDTLRDLEKKYEFECNEAHKNTSETLRLQLVESTNNHRLIRNDLRKKKQAEIIRQLVEIKLKYENAQIRLKEILDK